MKIAIVIPVYNGLKYLKKSLPPIIRQIAQIESWKFRIVISDDNSNDGTDVWLSSNYPEVIVLKGNGSLWWSGGINLGVQYVLADQEFKYVLLWNHDTVCADDYFDQLVKNLHKYDAKTLLASKIFFMDQPDVIFNLGAFFNPSTGKYKLNGYKKQDSEEFNRPCLVDWTGGMGTLIPVDVFRHIGLFDQKNFPQYHGDSDFLLRAKASGYKLMAIPDLKIWNDKSSSGLEHKNSWRLFFRSLFSIKSNNNIIVEFKFLKRHSKSLFFLFHYLYKIFRYSASFFKHWLLSIFK